jgi:hypothetical protein
MTRKAAPRAAPGRRSGRELEALLQKVRACRVCEAYLPFGPRPVLRAAVTAQLVIVGQAPGRRVHESGIPWNDPSGDRLRDWLALDRKRFYDQRHIAIIPAAFCYPGTGRGGDLPPRPECAPHRQLRAGVLPRRSAQGDADRHGAFLARLPALLHSASSPQPTQPDVVQTQPLVRRGGDSILAAGHPPGSRRRMNPQVASAVRAAITCLKRSRFR